MATDTVLTPALTPRELRGPLDNAWHQYVSEGTLNPRLRSEIAESWVRAHGEHGIDPQLRRPRRLLSEAELEALLAGDEALRLVRPVFEEFSDCMSDSVLTYFNGLGDMLLIKGDAGTIECLHRDIDFRPGSNWSEGSAGTNGPGTALVLRRPFEVCTSEHLVQAWHKWSCAAAPFFAPGDRNPVGVIDVTGPWETQSRHALNMARAVARTVEERLRASIKVRDEVVRHALRAARGQSDALVAVDARCRVLGMNEAAQQGRVLTGDVLPPGMEGAVAGIFEPGGASRHEIDLHCESAQAFTASPVHFEGLAVAAILRLPVPAKSPRSARVEPSPTPALHSRYDFTSIIGGSSSLKRAVELARNATHNDLPVVLSGESGTGKELFAHSIHSASRRAGGPFVVVNCGSLPAELIEAELFGYEPGAFTGARKGGSTGRFEDANGGTIFLDEVGELPPHAQVVLLRVLQEKEVVRVGASTPRKIDARVIAATNRPLDKETQARRFRLDLYFRLSVLKIAIPPLRDRGEDLFELAKLFLAEAEKEVGRTGLSLAPEALAVLRAHCWPGNVRELKNVILRAASTAPGSTLTAQDITLDFTHLDEPSHHPEEPTPFIPPPPAPAAEGTLRDVVISTGKTRVAEALELTGWNVVRAAQQLGVSRMTLYRLIHRYQLSRER